MGKFPYLCPSISNEEYKNVWIINGMAINIICKDYLKLFHPGTRK